MPNIRRFILRAKFQIQLFTQPMETIRYAHTHSHIYRYFKQKAKQKFQRKHFANNRRI